MEKAKKRIFDIIQIGNKSDIPSTVFDIVISFLIVVSIAVTFMQTFEELDGWKHTLAIIEFITIIVFLIEYILRIWTANYLYEDLKPANAVFKYIFSFYGIVDLLTIVSFFIPFIFTNGFVALRMLRVVRIMRLFKLNSSYDAFNVITDVIKDKSNQIISSVFMISVLLIMSSMCMYSLEHEAQPENFENAFSGIWWSVSTLLTVGYGDIYPVTIGGRIVAIIISFLGVGMVAIPTGIISAGFVEHYTRLKSGDVRKTNEEYLPIEVPKGHQYIGKRVEDIVLPEGLYVASVVRGQDVTVAYDELEIMENDIILVSSKSEKKVNATIVFVDKDK